MRIQEIREIASSLEATASGEWLADQLVRLEARGDRLNVALLVSAPQSFDRVMPNGEFLDLTWHKIGNQDEERAHLILSESDLLVWAMAAIDSFPATPGDIPEAAKDRGVPIWAVIADLDRLSNPERFKTTAWSKNAEKLPDGSCLLFLGNDADAFLARLRERLEQHGPRLAEAGHNRRLERLARELGERLRAEISRCQLESENIRRWRANAELGLESVADMTGPLVDELLAAFGSMVERCEELRLKLETASSAEKPEEVHRRFLRIVQSFADEDLKSILDESQAAGNDCLARWVGEQTRDLERYFAPQLRLPELRDRPRNPWIDRARISRAVQQYMKSLSTEISTRFRYSFKSLEEDAWARHLAHLDDHLKSRRNTDGASPDGGSLPEEPAADDGIRGRIAAGLSGLAGESNRRRLIVRRMLALALEGILDFRRSFEDSMQQARGQLQEIIRDDVKAPGREFLLETRQSTVGRRRRKLERLRMALHKLRSL